MGAGGQASWARRERIIAGAHLLTPTLTHIADFLVEIGAPIAVGETAHGLRRVVPIIGGVIQGVRLNGTILNAGADYQVIFNRRRKLI